MARIVNVDALRGFDWMGAHPKGFDGTYPVVPGEPLDVAGAIRGSINSWLVGDFGYDASNPYHESLASGNGLSIEQVQNLANLKIAPDTAGFFNIPICETFDLRYFPPAGGGKCIKCGFGGTPSSKKKFTDAAVGIVRKAIKPPPHCVHYKLRTWCLGRCPKHPYGPEHAQQNAAGYSNGTCSVHGMY